MLNLLIATLPDGAARAAVGKALEQHDFLTPSFFVQYVTLWRHDITTLPDRLATFDRDLTVEAAMARLGLVAVQCSGEKFLEQSGVA
jgi:hypothetical protein